MVIKQKKGDGSLARKGVEDEEPVKRGVCLPIYSPIHIPNPPRTIQ